MFNGVIITLVFISNILAGLSLVLPYWIKSNSSDEHRGLWEACGNEKECFTFSDNDLYALIGKNMLLLAQACLAFSLLVLVISPLHGLNQRSNKFFIFVTLFVTGGFLTAGWSLYLRDYLDEDSSVRDKFQLHAGFGLSVASSGLCFLSAFGSCLLRITNSIDTKL